MYLYPWDLRDEGAGQVLARLRDVGIDAVSVATSYHAGKFVRPHAPGKVYFPEDGTIYFRPEETRYGRIKPRANSMVTDYEALRHVEKAAPELHVTSWTVGLHNTPLGMAYPDTVARNCFGDPLFNSLCPANPDVREYLTALCGDIASNQPVAEIAIETPGWQAYRHGHHHEFELIELTPAVQVLLGFCFCTACHTAAANAGIDLVALATQAREALEAFFADGTPPGFNPQTDPDWRAYLDWRAATVTSLVAEVHAAMPDFVDLAVIPSVQSPNRHCWIEGSDLKALAAAADRLEVPAYQKGPADIADDVREVCAAVSDDAQLGFILRPTYPSLLSADEVRQAVQALVETSPASISFYNYGHMRLSSLEWIAAAF